VRPSSHFALSFVHVWLIAPLGVQSSSHSALSTVHVWLVAGRVVLSIDTSVGLCLGNFPHAGLPPQDGYIDTKTLLHIFVFGNFI